MRLQLTSVVLISAFAVSSASATVIFSDNFDNTTNGDGAAVTVSALSAQVGAWDPASTGAGINDHDDFGEIAGNAAGLASTDNAILIDTGLDNNGSDPLGVANNTNTILQGNFTQGFDTTNTSGEQLVFSWLWYSTRVTGNLNNNQRNMRIALSAGGTREIVIALELHNGTVNDIVWRDGNDDFDDNILYTMERPTAARSDGDYSDDNAAFMRLIVDSADGSVSIDIDDGNDGSFEVTGAVVGYNDASLTKDVVLDNFELFLGGANNGTKGAFFDDFNAEIIPEPSSLALMGLGALALLRRRR